MGGGLKKNNKKKQQKNQKPLVLKTTPIPKKVGLKKRG